MLKASAGQRPLLMENAFPPPRPRLARRRLQEGPEDGVESSANHLKDLYAQRKERQPEWPEREREYQDILKKHHP